MEANETHQHKTKSEALKAIRAAGLDPESDVTIGRANVGKGLMRWGWEVLTGGFADDADAMVQAAEAEFGPMQTDEADDDYQSIDAIMARNAARNAGLDIDATAGEVAAAVPVVVSFNRVPVGVDSEIAHFHVVDYPVARLPVVPPYVPGEVVELAPVVDSTDATEGLLICDAESVAEFPTEGDTYIQLGPFLPFEGKNELLNLSKRMGIDGTLSDDMGRVIYRTSRKVKSGPVSKDGKPRKVAMGAAAVGPDSMPVRPPINSVAHKSCEKLLDKIEDASGDLEALLAMVGTPGFKGGFTYGNIVVRYLTAWIEYRRANPANDDVPGEEVTFAEAAD